MALVHSSRRFPTQESVGQEKGVPILSQPNRTEYLAADWWAESESKRQRRSAASKGIVEIPPELYIGNL